MSKARLTVFTCLALLAFAGNSLLCRAALRHTPIDAASFTTLRLISGAVVLWLLAQLRPGAAAGNGSWASALALFAYAAAFSFAYLSLATGTGALLLFGSVQATMIGWGLCKGERFSRPQLVGLLLALGGLVVLLLPGLSAPPIEGALLMITAGAAWGIYTLRGRGAGDPLLVTGGNFLRAVPMALLVSLLMWNRASLDGVGVAYAVASGAVTSGLGYAVWYAVLPQLRATQAATLQLSVPVLAALGGIAWLAEPLTPRLVWASAAVLGGIALVIRKKKVDPA